MNASPSTAFGWPGIPPKWTSSSKEGVGTAYTTSSRVWFTLSHGILNEVYYPTIDRPQIRDLQFMITDGESFFHTEQRDLDTTVDPLEAHVLGYRVINDDRLERYRIVKEIIADPHQSCVLIRARLEGHPDWVRRLKVYVLLAPHLDGGGGGNSARAVRVAGRNLLIAWKKTVCLALGADVDFSRTSCGYVGASDGWQDLHADLRMDWTFDQAVDGNVALTGELDLSRAREFTVGLAFGDCPHAAETALLQSLNTPFQIHREKFIAQWQRTSHRDLGLSRVSGDRGRLCRISEDLLLAHEDKTFAGATIASASIPWGHVKGDEDLGGYHLVWTRDMVHSATGLMACNHKALPNRALVYLTCSQQPDGGFPQNFWLDGTPYWTRIQLDQVAFPVILAWRLWKAGGLGEFDVYPMVKAAAGFMIRQGPVTEQERWEENSGYSPSTLASNVAALICAAEFADAHGGSREAGFLREYADFLESHIERWTVTTAGSLVPGILRHYIRIHPVQMGDWTPDEEPNRGVLTVLNRPPGSPWIFPSREVVDAGFLELVRYGIRRPGDALIEDSLRVVDAVLKVETPFGPCWRRYNHDGYGERPDGRPFEGWGQGRAWPVLTGERGHYELAAGRDPMPCIRAMERFASGIGMLPEQIWDEADRPEIGLYLGRPAGSAMPLMWAHAEYLKLLRSVSDGKVYDRIPPVAERYLGGKGRRDLEVWKPVRRVQTVRRGQTLRVQSPFMFRLRWTTDEWRNHQEADCVDTGLGIGYVDIPISVKQRAPIRFAFFRIDSVQWEGRDGAVQVVG